VDQCGDEMKAIQHESIIESSTIDHWNEIIEKIKPEESLINRNKTTNYNVRSSTVRWVNFESYPLIYQSIASCILPIVDAESGRLRFDINRSLEIQHTTYFENDHYARHSDIDFRVHGSNPTQRKISVVVMMSNPSDYMGGDLVVDGKVISREKGTVVLFPPFLFHQVERITKGIRKTLVIWVHGPPWK